MCMHSVEWAKRINQPLATTGITAKCCVPCMVCWMTRGMHQLWQPGMNMAVPKWSACTARGHSAGFIPIYKSGDSCLCSLQDILRGVFLSCDSEVKARARRRQNLLLAHGSWWHWPLSLCRFPLLCLPRRLQVPAFNSMNLLPVGSTRAIHTTPELLFL